jgi:hypothetical protein
LTLLHKQWEFDREFEAERASELRFNY